MKTQFVILLGLGVVLACVMTRPRNGVKPAWAQQLKGWQKVFGVIALVATMLIILNPEFFALGLLGDTAFFDMFVLALSLQMHMFFVRACRACVVVLARAVRWVSIPSPRLSYLMAITALAMGEVATLIRKACRIVSSHAMA